MKKIKYTELAMDDIHPEARNIAVAWIENYQPNNSIMPEIAQKVKLASDIMNFAIAYHEHQIEQLKQHGVSGKRPFECPNCHATLQEVEMTNSEILDALKAACASGAVDKTVSDGCFCGSKDFVTRHMIRQCADCGRPV